MTYNELLTILNMDLIFSTLGGRSSFRVINENNNIIVINSRGKRKVITKEFYKIVWNHFWNELDFGQRYISQNYTDTAWDECPDRIFAPYLPAVWRELI